jgi:succinoglycan biosynthesis transport protein ExoP
MNKPMILRPGTATSLETGSERGERAQALITQVLSAARRRKWIIIGAILGCLIAGLVVTLLTTPQYTATTLLEIQRDTENFANVAGAEQKSSFGDQEFYQTQYGLLRSKTLADRVATDLRLGDDETFFKLWGKTDQWFANGRPKPGASTRQQRISAAGDILLAHMVVQPQRLSRLVGVAFTSPDAGRSKQIVDKWATDFIQVTLERRYGATAYARQFLEARLQQLRSRIDEGERRLVAYAGREGIVNLPGENGPDSDRPLVGEDLAALNKALAEATADRVSAQARSRSGGGTVTEALNNNAITGLRQKRAELAADYAKLMVQFEPGYPPAEALQKQIAQLDSSIAREESRVKTTLGETYEAALAREQALRAQVDQLKTGVLDFRRRSIQYNILQRDVDTNRQLYAALLSRYKEIGVAGGVGVNNIAVVDPAELPTRPSSPRLLVNMALALMLGVAIGLAGALVAEQIDQGIADPGEVADTLGVPLLGTIPRATGDTRAALDDRKSAVNEAYLSLQTNLAFTTSHGLPRSLAVTSSRPAEGKTTTSFALSQSLARSGHRTLLLDADLRSPSIHHLIGVENRAGFSNLLSGEDDLDSLVLSSGYDNLWVMTAGPQPPSAPELLSSERFGQVIERLAAKFDNVVLDAPPVMGLADAPLIGSQVEGTIFVIESHATQKSMAAVALGRLSTAGVTMLGAVLTKFDARRAHFGLGYEYAYGYGYGDTAKK